MLSQHFTRARRHNDNTHIMSRVTFKHTQAHTHRMMHWYNENRQVQDPEAPFNQCVCACVCACVYLCVRVWWRGCGGRVKLRSCGCTVKMFAVRYKLKCDSSICWIWTCKQCDVTAYQQINNTFFHCEREGWPRRGRLTHIYHLSVKIQNACLVKWHSIVCFLSALMRCWWFQGGGDTAEHWRVPQFNNAMLPPQLKCAN